MDRLPEENGDDPRGLTRQPAVSAPMQGVSTDSAMALLRRAADYGQARKGNVTSPEIEAVQAAQAANQEAQHALKYSVHGIPEGINHVDEMERLKGLINTGTATANDYDNFITLEQFMKEQAARTEGGADHGAHQPGTAPAPVSAGPEKSEVPPPAGAARSVRSQPSGAGQSAGGPRMDRGQVSSPRVQPAANQGRPARGPQPAMEEKPAAKPAVKGKAPSAPAGPTMEQLRSPNPYKKPAASAPAGPTMKTMGGRDTGKTNEQGMRVIGAPEGTVKPYQAPPAKREPSRFGGPRVPYESPSGRAYQETVANLAPQALMGVMGLEAARAGLPVGKMAEKVETELVPGAMNMGRKLASKMMPKPKAPAPVNNNISRVEKPVGLVKASQPAKPTARDVRQIIRNAEGSETAVRDSFGRRDGSAKAVAGAANGTAPKGAKSATELSHKASEYMEKRDAAAASKAKAKKNIDQKKKQGKGQNL